MTELDQEKNWPSFVGPHEDRELELMLAGKKHLSSLFLEEGIEREIFPERQFDRHVAEGLFVKDVRVEQYVSADGEEVRVRSILYAATSETWRIPAMRMIQDIYIIQWGRVGGRILNGSSDRCLGMIGMT